MKKWPKLTQPMRASKNNDRFLNNYWPGTVNIWFLLPSSFLYFSKVAGVSAYVDPKVLLLPLIYL
jgi:hypothetical protein